MNRAQRREHGHLLDRVCPRCRTRMRVIGGNDPMVAIEMMAQPPRASFHAICDDCGRVEWAPVETVRAEYPRIRIDSDLARIMFEALYEAKE